MTTITTNPPPLPDQLGIIDAAKVLRIALGHAVSIAGTLLLTEVTLTDIDDADPVPMPGMPNMM